jgi:hypothetical protein
VTTLHTPMRPGWICAGCAQDWPCPTRRGQLTAEYDRAQVCLSLVMASYFVEASEDLCDVPAGELCLRFLGWLRSARIGGSLRHQDPPQRLRPLPPSRDRSAY